MKERLHKLLDLCIEAHKKGIRVSFEVTQDGTHMWHHSSDNSSLNKSVSAYYVLGDFEERFSEIESYLKELIADGA